MSDLPVTGRVHEWQIRLQRFDHKPGRGGRPGQTRLICTLTVHHLRHRYRLLITDLRPLGPLARFGPCLRPANRGKTSQIARHNHDTITVQATGPGRCLPAQHACHAGNLESSRMEWNRVTRCWLRYGIVRSAPSVNRSRRVQGRGRIGALQCLPHCSICSITCVRLAGGWPAAL